MPSFPLQCCGSHHFDPGCWLWAGCPRAVVSVGTALEPNSAVFGLTLHTPCGPRSDFHGLPSQHPSLLLSPHVPAGMAVLPSMPMAAEWLHLQLLSVSFLSTTMARPEHTLAQAVMPGRQSFAMLQKGAK